MANPPGAPQPPDPSGPFASEPRPRLRRRRLALLLGLLAGLLAVVAAAAVGLFGWLSPTPTTTVWEAITSGISDRGVPKATALEAFAYLYQVTIPGVSLPKGIEGGDEPTDGSGAMRWVQANWAQLTSDQQAVINRYLVAGPADQTIPIDPVESAAPSAGAGTPSIELAAARSSGSITVEAAPDAPAALTNAMGKELHNDILHIGPKLGMPVLTGGSIAFPKITLDLSDTYGGGTLFVTEAVEDALHYEPCHMIAWKNAWEHETVTGSGGVSPALHVLMTHEVVHCYQHVVWGSVAKTLAMPSWIVEGTALYLAADDTLIDEPMIPSMWTNGYFLPETALTNRTYDAFGYYALLAHAKRNLWKLMLPAWQAAATSSSPSDAFIGVLTGDAPDIRNNWAESYLRKTAWGDPWIAYGLGLPGTAQVAQHLAQAQPAPGWTGSLDARSNTVLKVDSTKGEVVIVRTDGLASVHDDVGNSALAFKSQTFCAVASCVCPKGTLKAGDNMAPDPMAIPFVAAFNAPEGGSNYSIVSETLAELCGLPTPTPSAGSGSGPGPCDSGCSDSNGDPHLTTVNQVSYDFQAAGEFTLLRSADGSVDIQARQEPFGEAGDVSINTAIAARVGSHRVSVYVTDGDLQAHIDGKVVSLGAGPTDLGDEGRLLRHPDGFEIDFPDGTRLWALSVADWGINAQIKPSAALKASGVGLLGAVATIGAAASPAPAGLGVPALPDGTRLPAGTDNHQQYALLYGQFADAWRVTDATTLFDYGPGKSTASYAIASYPAEAKAISLAGLTPEQRAAGEAACTGVTDPLLHNECVFDVGITGKAGFKDSYASVQSFRTTPAAVATEPAGSVAPETPQPGVVSGAVTVTHATSLAGSAVGPDDTAYLSVQAGDRVFSLISFDPRAGRIMRQVAEPAATEVHYAAGSLWLPGLKTDSSANNCSVTRVDPVTLAEQATIPIPCASVIGPLVGGDGGALWFEDNSNVDPATNRGAVVTRIDPATNKPAASVPLPSPGGFFLDSLGAVFYADSNEGYYRLASGSSAFDLLGTFASVPVPSGTGLWVESDDQASAQYVTHAGNPDHTIQIGGPLVGGDGSAAYAEVEVSSASGTAPELMRYPIDGSTPATIATPPTVDGSPLSYLDDPPPTAQADGVLKLWRFKGNSPQASLILLQWTPLR